VQIDPKENEGDKIEVVGKIVGQQIKKTFNFLYDKIQEGVITTLNQAIENQKEHERLNNRIAHSSNPSLDQQRFLFNNQHQIKIND
jgi:superoxide dismutase